MKKKILFICTQNVFRSYSAHKIAEFFIKKNDLDFEIDSAGTHAYSWERPYSVTFDTLDELSIEFDYSHKNKKVSRDIIDDYTIVICMTKEHKTHLKSNFGVDSYLFNEVVKGEKTDLQDDVESTSYDDLDEFVRQTIVYIYDSMEKLLENVQKI